MSTANVLTPDARDTYPAQEALKGVQHVLCRERVDGHVNHHSQQDNDDGGSLRDVALGHGGGLLGGRRIAVDAWGASVETICLHYGACWPPNRNNNQ